MTESERYGKWEVVQSISRGGQGQVYLVREVSGAPNGAVTVTGWCQLRVASSFLL